jgi:hypothetical protein
VAGGDRRVVALYTGGVATRKQIRRERKRRVHGIERAAPEERSSRPALPSASRRSSPSGRGGGVIMRGNRRFYPASLRRAAYKALPMVVLGVAFVWFIARPKHFTLAYAAATLGELYLFGVLCLYMMDRYMYQRESRRQASERGAAKR